MTEMNSIVLPRRVKDLTGQRFGRLLVLQYAGMHQYSGKTKLRLSCWRCVCDCGTTATVVGREMVRGHTASCECLHRDGLMLRNVTHGQSDSPEHNIWSGMCQRCFNTQNPNYFRYGDRGITVCQRWKESFEAFLEDMGPRPSLRHSIDRYPDQNGNYEKGNCRWATPKEQGRNSRHNTLLTFKGKTQPLVVWAEEVGIDRVLLSVRLQRGWSVERALTEPVRHRRCLPN